MKTYFPHLHHPDRAVVEVLQIGEFERAVMTIAAAGDEVRAETLLPSEPEARLFPWVHCAMAQSVGSSRNQVVQPWLTPPEGCSGHCVCRS